MTVQDVIDIAKHGELKNLAVGKDNSAILSYVNLGVLELYKRFPLKVEEHIIALEDDVTMYTMPSDYMWIVSAYEEVGETDTTTYTGEIPINKEEDLKSINTIGWNQVQIPLVTDSAYISIIYVAAPTMYTEDELSDEIGIPPQMVEALLQYIAYRAYSAVTSGENEDSSLYQKFEASCDRLLKKGMVNQDDMYMSDRIRDKGFV